MHPRRSLSLRLGPATRRWVALLCATLLLPTPAVLLAQDPPTAPAPSSPGPTPPAPTLPAPGQPGEAEAAKAEKPLPPEQLDALVAPIALYPDDLLGQVLVASTYPLEIIQLHQWLAKNKDLKEKALADALKKQPWDPSIQGLAVVPEVVKRLADDITWTTNLGNAFLAQQKDVMASIQRMRKKAQDNGALKTSKEQKVETQTVEGQTVIIVQQANPEVIYVPTYNPVVVYGPPVYPYPPIYYPPPPPPGSMFVAFSFGVMMGSAWHGGWGYPCGWHGGNVYVNHNNVYVNHNNQVNNINRGSGNTNWNHNPQHRGGAPYPSQNVANKYGGGSRGTTATADRKSGGSGRGGGAGVSNTGRGTGAGPSAGTSDRSRGGGSADRVGSRDVGGARSSGGFDGGSRDFSGSSARSGSSRGASSYSGSRGGGASRGGGGGRRR